MSGNNADEPWARNVGQLQVLQHLTDEREDPEMLSSDQVVENLLALCHALVPD